MGILISILLAIIGGFLLDKIRTHRGNKKLIEGFYDEVFFEFKNLFENINKQENKEDKIKNLALKIYNLSFMNSGKIPFDITEFQVEPEKLTNQVKYLTVYSSIKEGLAKTIAFVEVNEYTVSHYELQKTFDILLKETKNIINNLE